MAQAAMPPKQTLHERPALIALGGSIRLLPEHTKSYRKRHILPLIAAIMFVLALVAQTVAVVSRNAIDPRSLLLGGASAPERPASMRIIKSAYGFEFEHDTALTSVATQVDGNPEKLTDAELREGRGLTSVVVTPLPSRVPANEAATQLEIKIETDAAAFATFKDKAAPRTDIAALTANYFVPPATDLAEIKELARTTEQIGGALMTKAMYEVKPKFAGSTTTTVVWSGMVADKPFALVVSGIASGVETPSVFAGLVQSLRLQTDQQVQGLSTFFNKDEPIVLEKKYVADLVSPAVVKIYHVVCGSLVFQEEVLTGDICATMTGSGFFVSADGYVATNGHVVVYGAKDMFTQALLANRDLLKAFLGGTEMSSSEITEVMSRPDLTASVVAKIYDLPAGQLRLVNERQRTLVAQGSEPVDLSNEEKIRQVMSGFSDKDGVKQAAVVGYDYSAKDQLNVVANPKDGFSASDVALLKIDAMNTPLIEAGAEHITQNQPISIFGFPGDAENSLIDTSSINVTVTNGAISSIREAAGGDSRLYQTDADASRGNSGGPAVDEFGKVFGLLTYRYSTGDTTDAAKSYVRDYADFTKLVESKDIVLNSNSTTHEVWKTGLDLYAKRYYKAALKEFERVDSLYPTHRLVDTYIAQTKAAIAAGNDQTPPSTVLLVAGIVGGTLITGGLLALVIRHYGHHRVYRAYHKHRVVAHSH